jgi:glycosyltransferase involved in cell wall biosynthesis
MTPLRILHVVPTYLPAWRHGGPVAAVHGLCKALAARGHEVTVFTTDVHGSGTLDVPRAAEVHLDGVRVWYFPVGFPRRLYRAPEMAAALAHRLPLPPHGGDGGGTPGDDAGHHPGDGHRQADRGPGGSGFDIVHLHSVFLWPTAAAARAAERAGVPYLVAPRGMLVRDLLQRRGWLRKWLWIRLVERRTLARAAAVHVTSSLEAAEIAHLGLVTAPLVLVENGVEVPAPGGVHGGLAGTAAVGTASGEAEELSAEVRAALARRPLVLFLGRVSWKKGLDRLVPAMADVPGATLAVAGNDEEGHQADLERLAVTAGVADRVLFLGPVHGAAKTALLHGADLLVLPSYSENFGNVVLEAMTAALPVVVTPEVGLAAVVRESGAGVVAEGDPPRLAAALRSLLSDADRRRAMGERGAAEVARRFGWDTIAGRMEEVYRQILAAAAVRPAGSQPEPEPAAAPAPGGAPPGAEPPEGTR